MRVKLLVITTQPLDMFPCSRCTCDSYGCVDCLLREIHLLTVHTFAYTRVHACIRTLHRACILFNVCSRYCTRMAIGCRLSPPATRFCTHCTISCCRNVAHEFTYVRPDVPVCTRTDVYTKACVSCHYNCSASRLEQYFKARDRSVEP